MSNLNAPHFQNAEKARRYLEKQVWPKGRVCPHCGVIGDHYELKGKTNRPGLYKCTDCREPFTVTVGTVFERSKIGLHIWLQAVYLINSSKKGMSAKQLERMLGVTYKTAWFMSHRIREAMTTPVKGVMGGPGQIVEGDEAYIFSEEGKKRGNSGAASMKAANKIVSLVERGGKVRSMHVTDVNSANLQAIMVNNVHKEAHLMTDSSPRYNSLKRSGEFKKYDQINHSKKEYAKGIISTNAVEGYFSILKRGLIGTFHHVSSHHLQRYVNEFDFRFNNRHSLGVDDIQRTNEALKGISGKRLTYRRTQA